MDRVPAIGVPPISKKAEAPTPGGDLRSAGSEGETHETGSRGISFGPYATLRKYPASAVALSLLGMGVPAARRLTGERED